MQKKVKRKTFQKMTYEVEKYASTSEIVAQQKIIEVLERALCHAMKCFRLMMRKICDYYQGRWCRNRRKCNADVSDQPGFPDIRYRMPPRLK